MKTEYGSAPTPEGCQCDPTEYAALGHMTTCPRYRDTTTAALDTLVHRLDNVPDVRKR